jgi:hypothetical protein
MGKELRGHRYRAYVVYCPRRIPGIDLCIVSITRMPSAYRSGLAETEEPRPADRDGKAGLLSFRIYTRRTGD